MGARIVEEDFRKQNYYSYAMFQQEFYTTEYDACDTTTEWEATMAPGTYYFAMTAFDAENNEENRVDSIILATRNDPGPWRSETVQLVEALSRTLHQVESRVAAERTRERRRPGCQPVRDLAPLTHPHHLLADGVKRAAERLGRGAEAYAIHAGGQELPMHDSRFDPGFAVHYAVEANPGRHTIGSQMYYEMYRLWKKDKSLPRPWLMYRKKSKYKVSEKKAIEAAACSKFMNVLNGAGGCAFGAQIGTDRIANQRRAIDAGQRAGVHQHSKPVQYLFRGPCCSIDILSLPRLGGS